MHIAGAPPDRNCSMNFVRMHACCAQTREIIDRFLRTFSRNCVNLHAKNGENCSLRFQRWHRKIYLYLREERQPVLAKPYRVESRAFSSPNCAYANSRNSTRNRAISRVPARRYAISWVRARIALSHIISRKCNQQFRSGWYIFSRDVTPVC